MTEINSEFRACCVCGGTETLKWIRSKDRRGIWDGKSYLCKNCYGRLRRYGTTDKDKIEEYKVQYNAYKKNKISLRQINCQICGKKAKNYNLELDDFYASFDIIDVELNRLQVKGPTLERNGSW